MGTVSQKTLHWLYGVLSNDYRNANRTHSDVAQTLSKYPSFAPRTDVYTYENGTSSLLLNVRGTLPVNFRGTTYSFPISLWIPREYPTAAPVFLVEPTREMVVRPGQYTSGEGKIYHPYLSGWRDDKSNLVEFCSILQNIFAREPPVVARRQPPTAQLQPVQQREPPPIPPLPPEIGRRRPDQARGPLAQTSGQRGPPPPPPKEVDGLDQNQHVNSSPPLPPHPSRMGTQSTSQQSGHTNGYLRDSQSIARPHPLESSPSWRYNHGEPYSNYNASKIDQPQVRPNQLSPQPDGRRQNGHLPSMVYAEPPQGPLGPQLYANSQTFNSPPPQPGRTQFPDHTARPHQSPRQPRQQQPYAKQPPQMPKAKPQEDLLTSPFDNPLPAQPVNIAPPPIPPNPQKDALLSALSQSLTQQVQSTYDSNLSALPPLRAQQAAITSTSNAINAEMSQLNDLQALLSSNEAILHKAMQDADKVLEDAKRRKVPDVDDVLVAPSVVAGQLYQLVAEERAIENSRGVLNKALDRGRIGPGLWAKQYRSLAREEFLKKALIMKISRGMGLMAGESW